MRLGGIRNVDPEHGSVGGNQDAMAFRIDTNDGTVKTFLLGKGGGRDQPEEKETGEDGGKSRTYV